MSEQNDIIKTDILTTLLRRALNDAGSREAAMNAFVNKAATLQIDTHLIEVYDGGLFGTPGKFANENIKQWRERCVRVEGELSSAKDRIEILEKKVASLRRRPSSIATSIILPEIVTEPEIEELEVIAAEHVVPETVVVSKRIKKADKANSKVPWATREGFAIWKFLHEKRAAGFAQKDMIDMVSEEFGCVLTLGQIAGRLGNNNLGQFNALSKKHKFNLATNP